MQNINKKDWKREFRGLLEGMGWEFDNLGKRDAKKIEDFLSHQRESIREEIRKEIEELFSKDISCRGSTLGIVLKLPSLKGQKENK